MLYHKSEIDFLSQWYIMFYILFACSMHWGKSVIFIEQIFFSSLRCWEQLSLESQAFIGTIQSYDWQKLLNLSDGEPVKNLINGNLCGLRGQLVCDIKCKDNQSCSLFIWI